MRIDIITLFPEMIEGAFTHSIIKRAQEKDLAKIIPIINEHYSMQLPVPVSS